MEIDENNDMNSIKVRTLASFYPSSCIKATKDLESRTNNYEISKKLENDMDEDCPSNEERLNNFHNKCEIEMTNNNLRKVDLNSIKIPEEISEYADEVFSNMHQSEDIHLPTYGYMKSQKDVNEKMRAILVDWLIEVHYKFKLLPETLFITVNIIDRYLEKSEIKRQKLQLLGVTAMWISCKYEEIYAPEIKDFVYITDNAYEQKDILNLEFEVLKVLEFNITTPSAFRFLERYAKLISADSKTFNLAWYLVELPLIEYKMLKYKPSLISSAALFVALKIQKKGFRWNDTMNSLNKFSLRKNMKSSSKMSSITTYSEQLLRP